MQRKAVHPDFTTIALIQAQICLSPGLVCITDCGYMPAAQMHKVMAAIRHCLDASPRPGIILDCAAAARTCYLSACAVVPALA